MLLEQETTAAALNHIAQSVYSEQGLGDASVLAILEAVQNHPEAEALLNRLVRDGIKQLLYAAQHRTRATIEGKPNQKYQPKVFTQEQRDRAAITFGTFFMWPMRDGSKLKDATREDLLKDSERFQLQADGNARKARFLNLVAGGMKEGQVVSKVYTESRLAELMRKAEKE